MERANTCKCSATLVTSRKINFHYMMRLTSRPRNLSLSLWLGKQYSIGCLNVDAVRSSCDVNTPTGDSAAVAVNTSSKVTVRLRLTLHDMSGSTKGGQPLFLDVGTPHQTWASFSPHLAFRPGKRFSPIRSVPIWTR